MADKEEPKPPFRWDGPLPAPDFVMVPKLVHRLIMRHLSNAEFKVFYALLAKAYEWGEGNAELSVAEIEELTGVSRRMAQLATQALEDMGLIEIIHHQSRQHGHEANTYRVRVTDDPRYVGRDDPGATIAQAPATRSRPGATRTQDRARDPFHGKKPDQEISPPPTNKYTRGLYAVCPLCHARPHAEDCPNAARTAGDGAV